MSISERGINKGREGAGREIFLYSEKLITSENCGAIIVIYCTYPTSNSSQIRGRGKVLQFSSGRKAMENIRHGSVFLASWWLSQTSGHQSMGIWKTVLQQTIQRFKKANTEKKILNLTKSPFATNLYFFKSICSDIFSIWQGLWSLHCF